ncbi:hypothetical protein MTR_0011s0290 [Medicago truncatula]|uniref:Uncharacterized protein n=1 Tax=Medicago truncatula TaxID=3880 RepID=A0A072TJZ4_MEDTR|nr:hypothetical protein MTR_0011s0290 [Medicago truncatula]
MTSSTTQRIATTALESVLHKHFHQSSEVMVYFRSLPLEEGKCFINSFEFPQIHHRNCFMLHFLMARSRDPKNTTPDTSSSTTALCSAIQTWQNVTDIVLSGSTSQSPYSDG